MCGGEKTLKTTRPIGQALLVLAVIAGCASTPAVGLSVHVDNAEWAKEILERTSAQDISVTGEGSADYVRGERKVTGGGPG